MTFQSQFVPLSVEELPALAARCKDDGWRFVQMLALATEEGVNLVYSFMKDGVLVNHEVAGVTPDTHVPSITDRFLAAFVFENEAHDLFGVQIDNIAIDFGGHFYAMAQTSPMTVISPAQKEAREKAKKLAAAKAAKEAKAAKAAEAEKPQGDADAELEAKLAAMDPEKAAKVRAAMKAKAAKAAKAQAEEKPQGDADAELEAKLTAMDPEKAAKVRAAMAAKAAKASAAKGKEA